MDKMKLNLAEESLKTLKTKKISLNLDVDTLEFFDEFSRILNTTRTTAIISIIGFGMKASLGSLISSFDNIKKTKKHSEAKVEDSIRKLKALRKKWVL